MCTVKWFVEWRMPALAFARAPQTLTSRESAKTHGDPWWTPFRDLQRPMFSGNEKLSGVSTLSFWSRRVRAFGASMVSLSTWKRYLRECCFGWRNGSRTCKINFTGRVGSYMIQSYTELAELGTSTGSLIVLGVKSRVSRRFSLQAIYWFRNSGPLDGEGSAGPVNKNESNKDHPWTAPDRGTKTIIVHV